MGGSSVENPKLGTRRAAISLAAVSEATNGEEPVAIAGSPRLQTPDRSGVAEALPEPGPAGV